MHPYIPRHFLSVSHMHPVVVSPRSAMAELYSRLPAYYHIAEPGVAHTSLHEHFTLHSQQQLQAQSIVPMTVHKTEDGSMFASILTRSNTEVLAKQGKTTPSTNRCVVQAGNRAVSRVFTACPFCLDARDSVV